MTSKAPVAGFQMIYRSALEALKAGRFEDSIALLEKLAASGPPNGDVFNNLGTAHWKCGRLNKAEECYARAVSLSPDNPIAQNNYGGLLMELSRIDEAEKHVRRAHQLRPDHPSIANHLGLIQCRRGELAEAENSFQRAISMRPAWSDPHANLGNVYRDLKRSPAAEACYRQALAVDPANANAWRDLGALQFTLGRHAEAEEMLRKSLALRPNSEAAWNLLLQLLEVMNRLDEARAALKEARERFPDSPPIADVWGRLQRRDGKAAEAIPEMERIAARIKGTPANAMLFFYEMGQLYDRVNDADKAFAAFTRANDCMAAQPEAKSIDKTLYTKLAARTKAILTPEFVRSLPPTVAEDRASPIFLVGFPRSGTTLLEQILASHPGIYVAEEKPGVGAMCRAFSRRFAPPVTSGAYADADAWGSDSYPAALPRLTPEDIGDLRHAFWTLHNVDDALNGRMFVDKMPINLIHVPLMRTVFPKSRIILALRHPCDCVLSCFMQGFTMNPAMARFLDLNDSARFYDEMFSTWEHVRQAMPLDVHVIRYEDVVADFRPAVESLLSYLGQPWNDAVLEYDKTAQKKDRINTASYQQVTQKIYTRASGRWLRYKKHLAPILDILAPYAERYGYSMKTGE